MTENWRPPVDIYDTLLHNQKRVALEQRRPTIRRAADLVGPGINAGAVKVTDWSDTLAMFDGYYASQQGALNAPNLTDNFVGHVVNDDTLGGVQTLYSLTTGQEYRRYFNRSAVDPDTVQWSTWAAPTLTPSTLITTQAVNTAAVQNASTTLAPPQVTTKGPTGVFTAVADGVLLGKAGVYTGSLRVGLSQVQNISQISLDYPLDDTIVTDIHYPNARSVILPIHFYYNGGLINGNVPGLQVKVIQTAIASATVIFSRLALTRLPETPAL